jgi:hypothetical protein
MRINGLFFQAKQALLLWVFLKTAGRFRTEDPILRPLTAVDVPLRVVIADRFFFWDIICVAGDPRAFCRLEVLALWAGARSELG